MAVSIGTTTGCAPAPKDATCGPSARSAAWAEGGLPTIALPDSGLPDLSDGAGGWPQNDAEQPGVALAAAWAGHYQLRVQSAPTCSPTEAGACAPFVYLYDPTRGAAEDDASVHRQVVGTLGAARLHRATLRPEFCRSAELAIISLLGATTADRGGLRLYDLGATGLLAMAIAEHQLGTGDRRFALELDALGARVLSAIAPDGAPTEGSSLVWAQLHHALWSLYEATGDGRYRDALLRLAAWSATQTAATAEGELWEYPYIYGLWANEPLSRLYAERPEPWLAELVYLNADDVIQAQYIAPGDDRPGVETETCADVGGFGPNSGEGAPNWNHTIKLEAVADAARMAELDGNNAKHDIYVESTRAGAAWLMGFQRRGDETADDAEPGRALGGFPLFQDDPDVRIDIPGHGSIALLKAAVYAEGEAIPGTLGD